MIVDRTRGAAILVAESWRALAALFAWDLAVVVVFQTQHRHWMDQPALPVSLIGSAIALLVGIRNNAAYARWWEARTLWGSVINDGRNLGRQVVTLLAPGGPDGPDEDRPDLVRAIAAYVHALRAALARVAVEGDHCDALLGPERAARVARFRNRPNAVMNLIGEEVARIAAARGLDGAKHGLIDRMMADLIDAQGGLERIRNTPLVIQFSVLPRMLIWGFCLLLPLSMVQDLGWITPLGSTVVSFLFMALDEIGADLQDPFDPTVHALPMRAMATTVEIDLMQLIGRTPPPPTDPERGVLS